MRVEREWRGYLISDFSWNFPSHAKVQCDGIIAHFELSVFVVHFLYGQ